MSRTTLFRWSGIVGLVSALCIVIEQLIPEGAVSGTFGLLSPMLGIYALTGVYLWEREASGKLGGLGYIVTSLGLTLIVGLAFASAYVLSFMSGRATQALMAGPSGLFFLASGVVFLVGIIMFGIATIRANVLPRPAPVLMIVGYLPITVTPFMPHVVLLVAAIVFGGGLAWLSFPLWSGERRGEGIQAAAT